MHIYQQIRSCVAVVNFHPADCGYMVPGVAIRLGLFVKMLDEHEISHKSLQLIRHEIRLCKSAAPRSKQYFVREELLEIGTDVNRRKTHISSDFQELVVCLFLLLSDGYLFLVWLQLSLFLKDKREITFPNK